MATLIPALNSCEVRLTAGERRFAERLQQKLEDDYLLWANVPVGKHGFCPDFLVLHPRRGFAVLEVKDWRIENAEAAPARLAGWGLASELPGFHKVTELKRRLGESRAAGQMVYSDGLAAVSVFIEPLEARRDPPVQRGLASMGAIHIYTREVANHIITVVGEAPAVSVQRIADAVEFRRSQQE